MDKELKEIIIFTARFVEYQTLTEGDEKDFVLGDERVVLDVMVDKGVIQRRVFSEILIRGIENPRNVIISVASWPGTVMTTFINGNRYWKLFEECGWVTPYEVKVNRKIRTSYSVK